uniref:Protein kinase domain-containing protein n=1 Tax=Oryza meridionalis TaxID=40149 RepID=A0A0E0DGM5_9ORYZ
MARLLGVSFLVAGLGCALLVAPSESAADDVSALLAFKKAIFEDPLAKLSDWNSKDENPCGWTGVGCSPFDSRVVTLDLRANRLDGAIPPEIGNLTSLTELQLSNNSLTGTIPGSNDSSMVSTNRDGQIGLCRLTQLTDMDLSYNYLAGDVPTCFTQIRRLSLVGNCFENNDTTNRPDNQCENSQKGNESSRVDGNQQKSFQQPLWLLILEVITAISLLTVLTLCTIAGLRRCKARSSRNSGTWTRAISWKENTVISIDDDLLANVPKISRQELAEACEDFSNIIGSTHDTVVYKGTMKDGSEIAVVSLSASVVEMARLSHENVAKMVGYSKESDPFSRMLVFQYPPNGTLYEHLHDGEGYQLSWPRRMKIALNIARALRYLHTEMQPPFAVAALTSSSVYLTEDFSPKIIDFERWRALLTKPGLSSGSIVNGSFNNIIDSRHRRFMDIQANTFAFGVILLELISGRAPVSKDTGDLVDWARKHLDQTEEFIKLVDPKLMNANHENLGIVCNVVNLCIDAEPCRRPSMNMITAILEEGIDTSPATVLRDSSLAWAEAEIAIS